MRIRNRARITVGLGIVAVAVVLGSVAVSAAELPPGGSFIDDDGSPHEGFIEAIAARGITSGCNPPANDRFCPQAPVTRQQMAVFLDRALGLPDTGVDYFIDDDGSLFEPSINRLAAAGITRGCGAPDDHTFCPTNHVSRAEMAAFVVRAFAIEPAPGPARFSDTSTSVFADAIEALAGAGVTKGCNPPSNDLFCPRMAVTRQQMATFLSRAMGLDPVVPTRRDRGFPGAMGRSAWGAEPPLIARMTEHTIEALTVHHGGDQLAVVGPPRYRSWQSWHQERGWGDLAYHYIIGVDGTVYEGRDTRYAGDTGTNYDPAGHFLVVVEGNFEIDEPTQAQLDALVRVLAWASQTFGVSPSEISAHRDHAATACPGGNLYPYVASGELESDVRAQVAAAEAGGQG